jgi:hypothetical protein
MASSHLSAAALASLSVFAEAISGTPSATQLWLAGSESDIAQLVGQAGGLLVLATVWVVVETSVDAGSVVGTDCVLISVTVTAGEEDVLCTSAAAFG